METQLDSPLQPTFSFVPTTPVVEQPVKTPKPIPLRQEMNVRPEFPVDSLCPLLKDAVEAIVDIVNCPADLAALSVLGAASLAVQAHADIVHPISGKPQPLSLNLIAVAESGERKTSADNEALKPAKPWELQFERDYKDKMRAYDRHAVHRVRILTIETAKRRGHACAHI